MTESKPDIVIPGDGAELLGQILQANANWSADIQNRVEENYQREITDWKQAFLALYEAVDAANLKVDSKRIDDLLFRFGQKAGFAMQPGWWEEKR